MPRVMLALFLVGFLFTIYGVNELRDAWTYETSQRDGWEAILIAVLSFTTLGGLAAYQNRKNIS